MVEELRKPNKYELALQVLYTTLNRETNPKRIKKIKKAINRLEKEHDEYRRLGK